MAEEGLIKLYRGRQADSEHEVDPDEYQSLLRRWDTWVVPSWETGPEFKRSSSRQRRQDSAPIAREGSASPEDKSTGLTDSHRPEGHPPAVGDRMLWLTDEGSLGLLGCLCGLLAHCRVGVIITHVNEMRQSRLVALSLSQSTHGVAAYVSVHGHEKVPAGGHLRSPLVATKVPTCGHEKSPPLTEPST